MPYALILKHHSIMKRFAMPYILASHTVLHWMILILSGLLKEEIVFYC